MHVQSALGLHSDGSKFDTVLMGWNTYTPALDAGIASPYPHLNQVVVSRHRRNVPPDISLSTNPRSTIRQLRGQPERESGWPGGSVFDEIDHLTLKINPVVLGDRTPPVRGDGL